MEINTRRKMHTTYQYNVMSTTEAHTEQTKIFIWTVVDGDDSAESRIFLILSVLHILPDESRRLCIEVIPAYIGSKLPCVFLFNAVGFSQVMCLFTRMNQSCYFMHILMG
jgi:hypothetical protein